VKEVVRYTYENAEIVVTGQIPSEGAEIGEIPEVEGAESRGRRHGFMERMKNASQKRKLMGDGNKGDGDTLLLAKRLKVTKTIPKKAPVTRGVARARCCSAPKRAIRLPK
jgi:hypothetical protein